MILDVDVQVSSSHIIATESEWRAAPGVEIYITGWRIPMAKPSLVVILTQLDDCGDR